MSAGDAEPGPGPAAADPIRTWLAGLYPERGASPAIERVRPDSIPEPCRSLLEHDRNMTPTLERFCRAAANLSVLQKEFDADESVLRRVITLDCSGRVVELSSIRIYLRALPEYTHSRILSGQIPLGTMLIENGISQRCAPDCFLRVPCDPVLANIFRSETDSFLFGRRNRLLSDADQLIAELIEIIPGPNRLHALKTVI